MGVGWFFKLSDNLSFNMPDISLGNSLIAVSGDTTGELFVDLEGELFVDLEGEFWVDFKNELPLSLI